MQRIQVATLELGEFDRILQSGGNPVPVLENYFEAIGSTLIDRIFPDPGSMSPAEQQQLAQMQQAQQQANDLQALQLDILRREQDRLDMDSASEREKRAAEIRNLAADFVKTLSDALLTTEKAETEEIDNQINIYTTQLEAALQRFEAIGAVNERNITANPALQARTALPQTLQ